MLLPRNSFAPAGPSMEATVLLNVAQGGPPSAKRGTAYGQPGAHTSASVKKRKHQDTSVSVWSPTKPLPPHTPQLSQSKRIGYTSVPCPASLTVPKTNWPITKLCLHACPVQLHKMQAGKHRHNPIVGAFRGSIEWPHQRCLHTICTLLFRLKFEVQPTHIYSGNALPSHCFILYWSIVVMKTVCTTATRSFKLVADQHDSIIPAYQ